MKHFLHNLRKHLVIVQVRDSQGIFMLIISFTFASANAHTHLPY